MPTRPRFNAGNFVYHVFNRAVEGLVPFEAPEDYVAFLRVACEVARRYDMRILVFVVMPNHWHFVLWPAEDGTLSAFMQSLTLIHAKRWREARGTRGRGAVYQGRFRAIPIQCDDHLLRACLYVERNPLRARLVDRAEDWLWSSAARAADGSSRIPLALWPVPKPPDWLSLVNLPQPSRTVQELRSAIRRGVPFGNLAWMASTARRLGWPLTGGHIGRPRTSYHAIDVRLRLHA